MDAALITTFVMLIAITVRLAPAASTGDKAESKTSAEERPSVRTIGDIVSVAGLQSFPVEGVGLVVGLADTGSDPAPGADRGRLVLEMQKRGIRNPDEILRSTTTALVKVRARIPPAVRSCKSAGCWCREKNSKTVEVDLLRPHKGDTFDVEIEVPTRDTTTSLRGGWLLETWLYETAELPGAGELVGHIYAKASGPVLVLGGLDGQALNPSELRRGRVLGGGISTDDRSLALVTDSDRTARWTIQIATRINERFPAKTRDGKPIAEPKDGQRVMLRIPPRYRQNMARYLEVLRYMPLSQDASQEAERMDWYAQDLNQASTARVAALQLEGIGHRAAEALRQAVMSPDPDIRFYAAESLAYLDDPKSADALAETAREIAEYRAHALTALSALDEPVSPLKLHHLMTESNSVELRYGAFRALRALDPDDSLVSGETVGDQLFLHEVASNGAPFIHISSRDRAEIVLFGSKLHLLGPALLKVGNKITVSASEGAETVQLSRFNRGEPVRHQVATMQLRDVIRKAVALGATYPDIVGMLVQADTQHNLPGRLEFDAIPDPTRLIARFQTITNSPSKAVDNIAMPNLYRSTDPRKPVKERSEESDEVASAGDADKERKYLSKPSIWDRLFRRSAN